MRLLVRPETKYEGTDGIAAFVGLWCVRLFLGHACMLSTLVNFGSISTDELFKSAAYLTDCYLPPLEGSDLGALSSAPQPQTAAEREVPVVNTPHNDDRDRGGKGTGNQVDLADLALGTHDSPKSPLRTKRSFLGSPVPSVESTSSNVRQRPRALSIVPTPASPSKMPALRRPRAFSIIPSSSSSGPTAALPPLPPLPSTPPKARGLQPSLTKHDASPTRPSALAGQISSQKEEKGDNPMHAPFNLAFRTNAPYFEWLERRGNGGRLKRFGRAMTGTGAWEVPGAIVGGQCLVCHRYILAFIGSFHRFPVAFTPAFSSRRGRRRRDWLDVDVTRLCVPTLAVPRPRQSAGGRDGRISGYRRGVFLHCSDAWFGEQAWRKRCPEFLDSGRAAFQTHDFFTPQPPWPAILQADNRGQSASPAVFLLRVITHDWPDAYVTR